MLVRDRINQIRLETILEMLNEIADKCQEHFVVITLNSNQKIIRKHTVFIGTVDAVIVHPREIFACALEDRAVNIIVAHNHPSGNPEPSRADRETTKQLAAAGAVLNIKLFDHIIVAGNSHFSFNEESELENL